MLPRVAKVGLVGFCLTACATSGPEPGPEVPLALELLPEQGVSGMVVVPSNAARDRHVVVVHDSKVSPDELSWPRLGVIRTRDGSAEYTTVAVDWTVTGPASDLEAACLVPGTDDQLLAVESGYYQGDYGRLFHLQLGGTTDSPTARVLAATQLPLGIQEAEGLACAQGAEVDGGSSSPLKLLETPVVVAQVAHLKIEGLSGPIVPGSWLSIGTEDEALGTFWMPLFVPNIQARHR